MKARRQLADLIDQLVGGPARLLTPDDARKLRQAAAFLGVALELLEELPPLETSDVS